MERNHAMFAVEKFVLRAARLQRHKGTARNHLKVKAF